MDYKCYVCAKILKELNLMINHLRVIHFIKEKNNVLKCVVNSQPQCLREFNTFFGLRKHVKSSKDHKKVRPFYQVYNNFFF